MATRSQTARVEWLAINAHLNAPKSNPSAPVFEHTAGALGSTSLSTEEPRRLLQREETRREENEACMEVEAKLKQKRGCMKGQRERERVEREQA